MKLHTINLASYTKPEVVERNNKEWVEYGEDNHYYQYLIDRYNGSPTNNAIINGISDLIYGKGIDATDSSKKPEEYAMLKNLINPDCLRKVVSDLKMMGQAAFQIIYSKEGRKIAQVEHMPIQTLRAEKMNEDGEIPAYYYSARWDKLKMNETPQRIPAFGMSNEAIEILVIRPYRAGYYYYSPVDYQGGLPYAELEEEVANFHINNIKNGLSPSMLINFNNGVPDEEERLLIEHKIRDKFGGTSNAGNFILAFNESKEMSASIDAVPISDAAQQYEFLSEESMEKLMVAHRVTSPMLLGIKNQTGLGNNADEIETASLLFDNTIIRPFQNLVCDALKKILAVNGVTLDLYFKTLQPLEFIDRDASVSAEETEKRTGERRRFSEDVELSDDRPEMPEEWDTLVDEFIAMGEDIDMDQYEVVDEREVDYDQEEALDLMIGLASTGVARPNANSEDDGANANLERFLVRYQYAPNKVSSNSREFCKKMVKANKVYRKEDILAMSNRAVNAGFGPNGAATYSIWLYKGGPRCQHRWFRKTYMFKEGVRPDVNSPNAETISTSRARRKGFIAPANPNKVSVAPKNMKNKGILNPPSDKDIQTGI